MFAGVKRHGKSKAMAEVVQQIRAVMRVLERCAMALCTVVEGEVTWFIATVNPWSI